MKTIKKLWKYYQDYGLKVLWLKLTRHRKPEERDYEEWLAEHRITEEEENRQQSCLFTCMPKISIAVPVYETPEKFLREMIESVEAQTYKNWELCIADGSVSRDTEEIIEKYAVQNHRIKYLRLKENEGIVGNSNQALEICTGEYVGLLDHDDILSEDALYEVVQAINEKNMPGLIYSDEDKVTMDSSQYFEPHFKLDFNLDLLRSNNYICHFCVIKKEILDQIGGFRKEFEGAQDYDLILRSVEKAEKIVHIPKILYHWRSHQNSTAENPESKLFAYKAGKRAIEEHLKRMGEEGMVGYTHYPGFYHVKYKLQKNDKVIVVIHGEESEREVKRCRKSICRSAGYDNLSFIFADDWNKLQLDGLNGEYLLFVNCKVKMISHDWMQEMLALCQRKDVGIVGIKMYNKKDETIYHAGIREGQEGYLFEGFPREEVGYFHRESLQQDVDAVTKDFMMISMEDFEIVMRNRNSVDEIGFGKAIRESGQIVVADLNIAAYKITKS